MDINQVLTDTLLLERYEVCGVDARRPSAARPGSSVRRKPSPARTSQAEPPLQTGVWPGRRTVE